MALVGAILSGGASRRMGRDKALVEVDGVALARRVADAMAAAGCTHVHAIGGDAAALGALGLEPVPDRWPGEGPLGGLATALGVAATGDVVVVAPCDLLRPSAEILRRLIVALEADVVADVAAPRVDGGEEWVLAAWRADTRLADDVARLVETGSRRLSDVAAVAARRDVVLPPWAVLDADAPEDLP